MVSHTRFLDCHINKALTQFRVSEDLVKVRAEIRHKFIAEQKHRRDIILTNRHLFV